MPDTAAIAALCAARHGDPFSVLGLHADDAGALWVRALLPGAQAVTVHDAASGRALVALQSGAHEGWFSARVPRRRKRFDYELAILWADGATQRTADPYSYGALLDEEALQMLASGTLLRPDRWLGAHAMSLDGVPGTRFAVWAPNATRVSVVGDFNGWDGRRHMMRKRHVAGVWEIFVPGVDPGAHYKYELLAADGLLPLKADPFARAAEMRPHTASIVTATRPERGLPDTRAPRNRRDQAISIYEVHAASWRRPDGRVADWDWLGEHLVGYALELGFTHLELLPVSEHPYDGSWGYQALGLYAPTARHGDEQGFVRFVDAAQRAGLGVIVDWVPAHFPADAHGLARFDGTALYEYEDPREGFHRDWNTLIYNFGRHEVRSFLIGSAHSWIERFGIDGLRVDAVASMLYRDYSRSAGEWVPNVHGGRENLEAISLLRALNTSLGAGHPGAITLAEESTAFPGVSAPVSAGGLGFHYKWNMGWMNDTLRYIAEDPVHRRWHHDKLTFGLVYAFSENFVLPISHDEVVHGKGSMLGKMPGDDWQRFANLRAYYGFMWGHPGKKLLFMGQEFAQASEWNHDTELPWSALDDSRHAGVRDWVRDLNQLYRRLPALHQLDCAADGFEWLVIDDAQQSVLAWLRRDPAGGHCIVVSNFTPVPRSRYRIGVSDEVGALRTALNSDDRRYGGSGVDAAGGGIVHAEAVAAHGRARSVALDLPPLATVFLEAA
ncbi:MAG: 1,4-alpha-glucan branching protein GlgB [Xanthomonadales bacterium]|nr:1,4-alpha-glucan branching protein GlgB [Xanthomonadales bacterium]